MIDPKPRPNHQKYIETLRKMSPEERLQKAFELSDFSQELFILGLRRRFSGVSEERFREILLERLGLCHNRND